jgi:glycosyltransferase involved in cell wall biosynthesis
MKALFCHDHHYYNANGAVVSKGQYHNAVWDRYLNHVDGLTVLGRDGGALTGPIDGVNTAGRDGVSFELLKDTNSFKGLFNRRQSKETIRLLVADHDLIILRGISEIGKMAFDEARRQGKMIAMEMVACAWDELWYHGSIKAKLYAPYRFMIARHMAQNANAIIYVSQKFLQNRYPSNAPIQAAASNVQIDRDSFSDAPPPTRDFFKIGLIGTLKNRLKGVHIAIEAAKILKTRNLNNFRIHILGPGDAFAAPHQFGQMAIDKGVADTIIFDGLRTSGAPVLEWIRDLDLYIQPSFQEGVPRATIEAMSQCRAVIGSNAGGIAELLDNTCVIRRGDATALADKIEWMIKNPDIQKEQASRNYIEARKYTMDKLAPIRQNFWGKVVNQASQY